MICGLLGRGLETPAYMSLATLLPQAQDPEKHVVPRKLSRSFYYERLQCCSGVQRVAT
jgi:hypothetical protein